MPFYRNRHAVLAEFAVSYELAADLLKRMAALRTCHLRFREFVFVYFYGKILNSILTDLTCSDRNTFLVNLDYGCNLRRRAVVDALANGRFALKAAANFKQLCFWINQHGIVLRNPFRYSV